MRIFKQSIYVSLLAIVCMACSKKDSSNNCDSGESFAFNSCLPVEGQPFNAFVDFYCYTDNVYMFLQKDINTITLITSSYGFGSEDSDGRLAQSKHGATKFGPNSVPSFNIYGEFDCRLEGYEGYGIKIEFVDINQLLVDNPTSFDLRLTWHEHVLATPALDELIVTMTLAE